MGDAAKAGDDPKADDEAGTGEPRSGTHRSAESRPLTSGERDVLELLAGQLPPDHPARAEVPTARAVGTCGCGTCPSIMLSHDTRGERLVLQASHRTGIVLLFVDGGHLSYLELAPLGDDEPVTEFPPVGEITLDADSAVEG